MTSFTDNFNRADSTDLGAGWVEVSGDWSITSNQLSPGAAGGTIILRAAGAMASDDNSAQVTIAATTAASQGVWCRGNSNITNGYLWRNDGTNWTLFSVVGGSFTSIGTYAAAAAPGDVAKIQAVGTTIKAYVNGVERVSVTDTAVATGTSVGIRSESSGSLRYDDFTGADVTAGTSANAGHASGTGAAGAPSAAVGPAAGAASGSGAAAAPALSVAMAAGQATGSGAAGTVSPAVSPSAGAATATGAAGAPSLAVAPHAGAAAGSGTAGAPTVDTAGSAANPAAGHAAGAGAAGAPTVHTTSANDTPAGGGWYGLLDIYREGADLRRTELERDPVACLDCGEPLRTGPDGQLYCKFDGQIWAAGNRRAGLVGTTHN